jgi:hypothetical protein
MTRHKTIKAKAGNGTIPTQQLRQWDKRQKALND